MSLTHTVSQSYAGGSGLLIATSQVLTGSTEQDISVSATAGWTNHQITCAFAHSSLQAFIAYCDQAVTLDFNSTGSPAPQIVLAAGVPYIWYSGCGFANPFSADVTTLYVTNSGGTNGNLTIRALNT